MGVKVKKLEWERRLDSYDWHADCQVGTYSVGRVNDRCVAILRFVADDQVQDERVGFGATTAGAKRVAQADFDRRILSTLEHD